MRKTFFFLGGAAGCLQMGRVRIRKEEGEIGEERVGRADIY
jgi:hypothetical protein